MDEFTALDPSVAQVLNSALANGEIETTTGLVKRHPNCIIIATSNTYGSGTSRQYIANNQLDSSTVDRFVGGIVEVDYSKEYESRFNPEAIAYIEKLRNVISNNELRRIASTRMLERADKMLKYRIRDWQDILIQNWTGSEKALVHNYKEDEPKGIRLIKNGTA